MLRALTGGIGATEFDGVRCRLRGLVDIAGTPTLAGRAAISDELNRRGLRHGR